MGKTILIHDAYGGNPCPVSDPLHLAEYELVYVSHGIGLRPNIANLAREVVHAPGFSNDAIAVNPGVVGRITGKIRRTQNLGVRVRHLEDQVKRFKPNAIFALDIELAAAITLKAAGSVPVFGVSLGSDVFVVPERNARLRELIVGTLQGCKGVIALTQTHGKRIKELSGVDPLVIGGWIDTEMFANVPADPPPGLPVVLCLRGSRSVYRPEVVLRASAIAQERVPHILRMRVDPGDLERLKPLAPERIEWVTERLPYDQMPAEYARASVVFQAILTESLGYTAMEAMASGRLLVQPDTPLIRELTPPEQWRFFGGPSAEELAGKLVEGLEHIVRHPSGFQQLKAHSNVHFDRNQQVQQASSTLSLFLAEAMP